MKKRVQGGPPTPALTAAIVLHPPPRGAELLASTPAFSDTLPKLLTDPPIPDLPIPEKTVQRISPSALSIVPDGTAESQIAGGSGG